MEYLLDTNHLSYLEERHVQAVGHLAALLPQDRLLTSVVNVAELLRGVYLLPEGRRRRQLLNQCHQIVQQMDEILPVSLMVAETYAKIDAVLQRKGTPIPPNDLWIAAVALTRGAVLVTNDDHFARVEGLTLENWTR